MTQPGICPQCGDPLDAPSGAGRRVSCAAAHTQHQDLSKNAVRNQARDWNGNLIIWH